MTADDWWALIDASPDDAELRQAFAAWLQDEADDPVGAEAMPDVPVYTCLLFRHRAGSVLHGAGPLLFHKAPRGAPRLKLESLPGWLDDLRHGRAERHGLACAPRQD